MDKIKKAITKLSEKEKTLVRHILSKLQSGGFQGLDIKKLKGRDDIFRVRKGDIRVIYGVENKNLLILIIERRNEKTYKIK